MHDPGTIFVSDNRRIGYLSDSAGIVFQGVEVVLNESVAEQFGSIFKDQKPYWVDAIQVWNQTYEFDTPAVYV